MPSKPRLITITIIIILIFTSLLAMKRFTSIAPVPITIIQNATATPVPTEKPEKPKKPKATEAPLELQTGSTNGVVALGLVMFTVILVPIALRWKDMD